MPVPARQALRRLIPYYHPYRGQVAAGLVMVVTGAGMSTMIPALLRRGIDAVGANAGTRTLLSIAGLMLATTILSGILRFGMRQLLNGVSRRIETDLRHDVFTRLLSLDAGWYTRWRTGDLMARLTNDLGAVRMASGPAIMYLVNTIAGGLFAMFMMIRISPQLTLVALLPMLGLPLLMLRLGKQVHRRFEVVQSQFSHLTTRAQENLAGVRVVRAYRQEDEESRRFAALGESYLEANMSLARLNGIMNPGFALLAGIGSAVTLGVGGYLLIDGVITVGGFVAFTIYLAMLTWPMIALGWTTNLLQRGAASMSRVLDLLDAMPYSVTDSGTAVLPAADRGRAIEFRNVWFQYPGVLQENENPSLNQDSEPRWVLRDVSFSIPAGGTLAIVGATGSGKSALMDLVPRFFDADRGTILIDGVDIRTLSLDALRAEIGYVPQESLLFSESVGANVSYGLTTERAPMSYTSEQPVQRSGEVVLPEMIEAAQIAQLTETVALLPEGYSTRLGERGINLSGGQKQRTALARALARRPHIVLLDDALSAVDTQTEAAILSGLRGVLSGRTALIASHRVSTVRDADLIVVLEDGAIVEQGTHDELVRDGGRYASLLRRQQLLEAIEGN
jgi:ATP-binding cassette subfamily B protein